MRFEFFIKKVSFVNKYIDLIRNVDKKLKFQSFKTY